jgi:hypothetical protein
VAAFGGHWGLLPFRQNAGSYTPRHGGAYTQSDEEALMLLLAASGTFAQDFAWPVAAGVVVALISVLVAEYFFRHRYSHLVFEDVASFDQSHWDNQLKRIIPEHVWRLPIRNEGAYAALDCRADVRQIADKGIQREGIIISPLNWTHNPLGIFTRAINPHETAYLDICNRIGVNNYKLSNYHMFQIENSSRLDIVNTLVVVDLYQASGQRHRVQLSIHWDDDPTLSKVPVIERSAEYIRPPVFAWLRRYFQTR